MNLEVDKIQGNIVVGYKFRFVAHLFAAVTPDNLATCRAFLGNVDVTPASWGPGGKPSYAVNLGISYSALAQLAGDPEGRIKAAFPAFAAGMSARARLLRDPDISTWADRHLWVSVHADDPGSLVDGITYVRQLEGPEFRYELRGAAIVKDGHWYEHFGFRDDIANPVVEGVEAVRAPKELAGNGKRDQAGNWIPLKAGEFILGYPDELGAAHPQEDALLPLFRNGTFAVFRDLKQDVPLFRKYTTNEGHRLGFGKDLAAKIIGRQEDGTPLIDAKGGFNDFDYEGDPKGLRCPMGAHVRRSNHRDRGERDGGRHRLIRRGRPYGSPLDSGGSPDESRGLYFVGLNASIEDQFEFIQRRWINDRVSTDGDLDPLVGVGMNRMFVIEGQEPPLTLVDMPSFVTFQGGEYYFVPSLEAIRSLANDSRVNT